MIKLILALIILNSTPVMSSEIIILDKLLNNKYNPIQEYIIQNPFQGQSAMNWYHNFKLKYKIPEVNTKRKIKVAVIDTGFNPKARATNLLQGYNNNFYNDYNIAHGSHVSGIILGVNSNIELISYEVWMNNQSSAITIKKSILSILDALQRDVDIINISMSGGYPDPNELAALKIAEEMGVIVVVAAGNDGEELSSKKCNIFPACYKPYLSNMIVVGNLTEKNQLHSKSNYGSIVDTYFYGTNVESLGQSSTTLLMTGTSQSAPFITGFLSLEMSKSETRLGVKEIKSILNEKSWALGKQKESIVKMWSNLNLGRSPAGQ